MSERILNNLEFFNKLVTLKGREQINYIETATDENIKALTELVYNLLAGNLNIPNKTRLDLKKHKTFLRNFSNPDISFKAKKKSLLRKRSVLSCIVSPILSVLGSCLGKVAADSLG